VSEDYSPVCYSYNKTTVLSITATTTVVLLVVCCLHFHQYLLQSATCPRESTSISFFDLHWGVRSPFSDILLRIFLYSSQSINTIPSVSRLNTLKISTSLHTKHFWSKKQNQIHHTNWTQLLILKWFGFEFTVILSYKALSQHMIYQIRSRYIFRILSTIAVCYQLYTTWSRPIFDTVLQKKWITFRWV